ncbi:MAG: Rpn family recombination-promoting nuclease/putative transposase [Clostridium sp.]
MDKMNNETTENLKRNMNNIHDKGYKDLYSNKEVFLDLVKGMLKAPWAKDLEVDDLVLVDKSYISSDYEETESDIVYSANIKGNEIIFYVLLEFQSTVDYRMPLRLFLYISEIIKTYAKNKDYKKSDRNLKIPAVVPMVLYNGKAPWGVSTRFRDIIYNGEIFGDNIIDFRYDLFDVNNSYKKDELLSSKTMTSAIFLLDQKINPYEFLQRIKAIALFFDGLNQKEMQVLKHWIKNTVEDRLADKATKILESSREEVEKMVASNAFIVKEMEDEAKAIGREEGIKLTKKVLKLFSCGETMESIAKKCGISEDTVKEIIE